jgi:hypothetical protein
MLYVQLICFECSFASVSTVWCRKSVVSSRYATISISCYYVLHAARDPPVSERFFCAHKFDYEEFLFEE